MKTKIKTIDITPNWVNLVPMFIRWIEEGSTENRQTAIDSIEQMAKAMDKLLEHKTHGGLTCACGDDFDLSTKSTPAQYQPSLDLPSVSKQWTVYKVPKLTTADIRPETKGV